MSKWASNKKDQLIFENWRGFLNEQEEPEGTKPAQERFFVILLGGSGTGKGALVGTNRAIGELQRLMGQSIGKPIKVGSADAIKAGTAGSRVVWEPDRVLRVHQWTQAKNDWGRMKTGEDPASVFKDIPEVEESLFDTITEHLEKVGGIEKYNTAEDYVGALKTVGGAKTRKQALAMADALDEKYGGDPRIQWVYKQMRKRPYFGSKDGSTIKEQAVAIANEQMKGVVGKAAGAADSFILDSAGEDLAEQNIAGELKTAQEAGFQTAIVLLATGASQSFLGNMERAIARSGRNVNSEEIMKFYNVLLKKHREFGGFLRDGLLDEYIVLEQDPIDDDEIENLTRLICNPGELLGIEGVPAITGNEIEGCIPQLANPDYLPPDEERAALAGAKAAVDAAGSPTAEPKNWAQAFAAAGKEVIPDPKAAKKKAMTNSAGLYAQFQKARATGSPEILRPINAREDFSRATAVIAKALQVAATGAKMGVSESKTGKRWKIMIG